LQHFGTMSAEPLAPRANGDAPLDRNARLKQRLALPVLLAALASVPAVFLTLLDEPARSAGAVLNTISGGVLIAETIVLLALSEHKLRWLKDNRGLVALSLLIIPAAVFAAGPVQLLRVVKIVGALRIVRVGRILKAGRILRDRAGLDSTWQRITGIGITLLVASFVALVLSDPTSHSRQVLDGAVAWLGVTGAILAGVVLAVATYVVRTARWKKIGLRDSPTEASLSARPAAVNVRAGE
jgi:CsoR family transcriptional regulator, copper-sensing transcriptional repressor